MKFSETRLLKFPMSLIYQVVADISAYPDFVPCCTGARVLTPSYNPNALKDSMEKQTIFAEMEVGFQGLHEKYISKVNLHRDTLIEASAVNSPLFDFLITSWRFERPVQVERGDDNDNDNDDDDETCLVHFSVDFQFRSTLYHLLSRLFMDQLSHRTMAAFENRVKEKHQKSLLVLSSKISTKAESLHSKNNR